MDNSTHMLVSKIENGTVIDKIFPGKSIQVLRILGIDEEAVDTVAVAIKVTSKSMGRKDLIKLTNRYLNDDELKTIIEQTINGAVSTIPAYMDEIKENKETFKVENPKEFVYGLVIGMALGIGGAILSAQETPPTPEDQIKVRDLVYKNIHHRFK